MASAPLKLAVGTVQFGLDYGLTSPGSAVPEAEVRAILDLAAASGVTLLDTAAAYGQSEAVIGRCLPSRTPLRIVSKIAPLGPTQRVEAARASLRASLQRLQRPAIYALLLHRQEDLDGEEGGALFEQMLAWKREGIVEKIGVSVYAASDAERLRARFEFDIVQFPLSLFDQRPLQDGSLRRLAAMGVEVHARSVLLQGLLLVAPENVPAHLADARGPLAQLRARLSALGLTPLQAALAFVNGIPDVSAIVVGVHTREHLQEILEGLDHTLACDTVEFALGQTALLDPRLWRA